MNNTIIDYNDHKDTKLLNENILESIHKVIEEESNANNLTADTFSRTSNTWRENTNAIFTTEKLDQSDELAGTLNDLTINDAEYYV